MTATNAGDAANQKWEEVRSGSKFYGAQPVFRDVKSMPSCVYTTTTTSRKQRWHHPPWTTTDVSAILISCKPMMKSATVEAAQNERDPNRPLLFSPYPTLCAGLV